MLIVIFVLNGSFLWVGRYEWKDINREGYMEGIKKGKPKKYGFPLDMYIVINVLPYIMNNPFLVITCISLLFSKPMNFVLQVVQVIIILLRLSLLKFFWVRGKKKVSE